VQEEESIFTTKREYGSTELIKSAVEESRVIEGMCFECCNGDSVGSVDAQNERLSLVSTESENMSRSLFVSPSSTQGSESRLESTYPSTEARNCTLKSRLMAQAAIIHEKFYGKVSEASRRARVESDNRMRLVQKASKVLKEQLQGSRSVGIDNAQNFSVPLSVLHQSQDTSENAAAEKKFTNVKKSINTDYQSSECITDTDLELSLIYKKTHRLFFFPSSKRSKKHFALFYFSCNRLFNCQFASINHAICNNEVIKICVCLN